MILTETAVQSLRLGTVANITNIHLRFTTEKSTTERIDGPVIYNRSDTEAKAEEPLRFCIRGPVYITLELDAYMHLNNTYIQLCMDTNSKDILYLSVLF